VTTITQSINKWAIYIDMEGFYEINIQRLA